MNIILMNWQLRPRFYGKNVQSMLKLGRAQGAAIAAALSRSVPIFEYAPRKIKMSITGRELHQRNRWLSMLMQILKFSKIEVKLDATDGLAAALCHFYQTNTPIQSKIFNSWKDFINKNPGRVKSNRHQITENASAATLTLTFSALSNSLAHASIVDPVVITSSTSKICLSLSSFQDL